MNNNVNNNNNNLNGVNGNANNNQNNNANVNNNAANVILVMPGRKKREIDECGTELKLATALIQSLQVKKLNNQKFINNDFHNICIFRIIKISFQLENARRNFFVVRQNPSSNISISKWLRNKAKQIDAKIVINSFFFYVFVAAHFALFV